MNRMVWTWKAGFKPVPFPFILCILSILFDSFGRCREVRLIGLERSR